MKQLSLECFIHGRCILRMFWVVSKCVYSPLLFTLGSTIIFIALFQEEKKCNSPVCKAAGASLLPRIILLPASFFLHYLEISVYNRCKTKSVARSGFVMDWIIASKNQIRFLHHCWLASLSSKYISVQHLSASFRTSSRQSFIAQWRLHNQHIKQPWLKTTQNRWWHHVVKDFIKNVVASANIAKSPEPQVISVINIRKRVFYFYYIIISRLGIGIEWPMLWL